LTHSESIMTRDSEAHLTVRARREQRLRAALDEEQRNGLRLAMWARLVIITMAAAYFVRFEFNIWQVLNFAAMAAFAVLGWLRYALSGMGAWSTAASIAIPAIDAVLIASISTLPPFLVTDSAAQLVEVSRPFSWMALLVVLGAAVYRPLEAAWVGITAALAWFASYRLMIALSGAEPMLDPPVDETNLQAFLTQVASSQYLYGEAWIRETLILAMMGIALGLSATRIRALTSRSVVAERARANLARYFSPSVVDHLAATDRPLGEPRHQQAGVLFIDIVGFTRLAETMPPRDVILLLRGFHSRVASEVFAQAGTLDKYIGDAAMATFGTPDAGPDDAARALACIDGLTRAIDKWNEERGRAGRTPIQIGIGAHYGPVVLGDIGDERRLEFAVLGDTVNVAARLERLTRELGATVVISQALADKAMAERDWAGPLVSAYGAAADQALRNREAPVPVLVRGSGSTPAEEPATRSA
jgi:adenylate cyclase